MVETVCNKNIYLNFDNSRYEFEYFATSKLDNNHILHGTKCTTV